MFIIGWDQYVSGVILSEHSTNIFIIDFNIFPQDVRDVAQVCVWGGLLAIQTIVEITII